MIGRKDWRRDYMVAERWEVEKWWEMGTTRKKDGGLTVVVVSCYSTRKGTDTVKQADDKRDFTNKKTKITSVIPATSWKIGSPTKKPKNERFKDISPCLRLTELTAVVSMLTVRWVVFRHPTTLPGKLAIVTGSTLQSMNSPEIHCQTLIQLCADPNPNPNPNPT